jgi:hypothetical protein
MNTPPTWKSSVTRALVAAALVFTFLLLTAKGKNKLPAAVIFTLIAVAIYIPAGYYLELTLYRRRQRKRAAATHDGGKAGGR